MEGLNNVHPEDIFEKESFVKLVSPGLYDCVVHRYAGRQLVVKILDGEFADQLLFVTRSKAASIGRPVIVRVDIIVQAEGESEMNVVTGIEWPKEDA